MAAENPYFPIKVPVPVDVLRRIDDLIRAGRTPFQTREEFVLEALRQLLVELGDPEPASREVEEVSTFSHARDDVVGRAMAVPPAEEYMAPPRASRPTVASRVASNWQALADELNVTALTDVAETALSTPPRGVVLEVPDGLVADEALFGLHNRDYPSLWAAERLCHWTANELIPLTRFRSQATTEALRLAVALQPLESSRPREPRLTALLPRIDTPSQRPGGYFAQAALGSVHRDRTTGAPRLHGPLFVWRLAALDEPDPRGRIAPTEHCYELLERLEGLTINQPHSCGHARAFFEHLSRHATEDARAFGILLAAAGQGASRHELLLAYETAYPDWRGNIPQTNLQGYIGRAREWGLLAPGRGSYTLTPLGAEIAETLP